MTDSFYVLNEHSTPETELRQSEKWIQKLLANPLCFNFSIELLPTAETQTPENGHQGSANGNQAKVIGLCGGHSLPEIGYIFDPSLWGRGYATEALKAFLEVYWEKWPDGHPLLEGEEGNYLKAITGKDGHASMAVLKKCGFEFWREEVEKNEGGGEEMVWAWRGWRPGFVSDK